jgi:TetR/AcrR family transcriptional regulator, mexJK operon transcriptional repressor
MGGAILSSRIPEAAMTAKSQAKLKSRGPGRLSTEATALLENRLLDAAEAVFLERGYARATIDGIARASGATRKTIYARYANKEEIFDAAVRRLLDAGVALPHMRARAREGDPRAILLRLAKDLIALLETPQMVRIYRLIFAEGEQMPQLARMSAELYDREASTVAATLAALRASGKFPSMPAPRMAAVMFTELVSSTARLRALAGPGAALPRAQAERYVATAVDFFLAGCGYPD